jgi:predicted glycogen debranching enzyme
VISRPPDDAEWLESDALGGFASGTVAGYRTRRYHALLLVPRHPPGDRVAMVTGMEVWVDLGGERVALSTQHYTPDVFYPRGVDRIVKFSSEPWPKWMFQLSAYVWLVHEIIVSRSDGDVLLAWRMIGRARGATLSVRPLLSCRDYHVLTHENPAFDFTPRIAARNVAWRPYTALPTVAALTNGDYLHEPLWYRNFLYRAEAARGLDCVEDLASPGTLRFDLSNRNAAIVLRASAAIDGDADAIAARIRKQETAQRGKLAPLDRAAEAYVVRRGNGLTIVAGFPWFTDWGRDTFIAMRGLVLARGHHEVAASILRTWADCISEGMLPNRFPDQGTLPEFNSVDASLWYVIVAYEFISAASPAPDLRARLVDATVAILDGYIRGTRFGIGMDTDGLLACGVPGMALTWMDARVGGRAITPRIGKPVEVQALWINALRLAAGRYRALAKQAQAGFSKRFWNADTDCLYDVVDADHVAGRVDPSIRPNQVFAVGGLPDAIVERNRASAIVSVVERELLTPMGLRTLARSDRSYCGRYKGGVAERDAAYHQGTVWPWLIGPFVDAWLRVHGDDAVEREAARRRFIAPLLDHLTRAGLGHVSEIADGDPPNTARGCPFQAWSLGELIRSLAQTHAATVGVTASLVLPA